MVGRLLLWAMGARWGAVIVGSSECPALKNPLKLSGSVASIILVTEDKSVSAPGVNKEFSY